MDRPGRLVLAGRGVSFPGFPRRRGLRGSLGDRAASAGAGRRDEEGRRRDYARAQISVLIGNAPAQFAYERAGFAVVDERRHPDFQAAIGSPGVRRMQRHL